MTIQDRRPDLTNLRLTTCGGPANGGVRYIAEPARSAGGYHHNSRGFAAWKRNGYAVVTERGDAMTLPACRRATADEIAAVAASCGVVVQ